MSIYYEAVFQYLNLGIKLKWLLDQCYFQLSPERIPPESQIPPEKQPKYKKHQKNASNLPPHMRPPEHGV